MAETIKFELVSPERLVKSIVVDMVVVPCTEGDIGVLAGHTALIGTVRPGVVRIHKGGKVAERIFVSGGFVEVTPKRCTLLAEEALQVDGLRTDQTTQRLTQAKAAMDKAGTQMDKAKAEAELAVAEAMVAAMAPVNPVQ